MSSENLPPQPGTEQKQRTPDDQRALTALCHLVGYEQGIHTAYVLQGDQTVGMVWKLTKRLLVPGTKVVFFSRLPLELVHQTMNKQRHDYGMLFSYESGPHRWQFYEGNHDEEKVYCTTIPARLDPEATTLIQEYAQTPELLRRHREQLTVRTDITAREQRVASILSNRLRVASHEIGRHLKSCVQEGTPLLAN